MAAAWREQLGDGVAGVGHAARPGGSDRPYGLAGGSEGVSRGWAAVAMA